MEEKEIQNINKELNLIYLAEKQGEEAIKRVDDFLLKKESAWDGLMNNKRDLTTIGVSSLVNNLTAVKIAEKYDAKVKEYKGNEGKVL